MEKEKKKKVQISKLELIEKIKLNELQQKKNRLTIPTTYIGNED